MDNSDQPAIANEQRKPPFQFSIAFLLWLTAACAFVLGIAKWTHFFFNPVLAAAIAIIITVAYYRKSRLALWCSLVGGAATAVVAYIDWLMNVTRFPESEPAGSALVAILVAIIGLAGGLSLSALPNNHKKKSPLEKTERRPSQVSHDE